MFRFFKEKKWLSWSLFGTIFILAATWNQATLDLMINDWFGVFYDTIQKAITNPGSVTEVELIHFLMGFLWLAGLWVIVGIIKDFFTSHYVFRWRLSMTDYYHQQYEHVQPLEGSSQRVQEDSLKFARIMESLGVGLVDSIMTLILFVPKLAILSMSITALPFIGKVDNSLVLLAIVAALGGTILLALVGIKLPTIEYDIQKEEASYRKFLVLSEDDIQEGFLPSVTILMNRVKLKHFTLYAHYLYFNTARWSYLQGMAIVPYVALAPTIAVGAITLGTIQQITRSFGRVETSLQYVVRAWPTIVELISVYRRLKEFEKKIR